ncbi:hypothetical protein AYI70_g11318 [Smittium culicis]|uniref:Uncharacterized protein n=1 Tax=Smittium culicis TaxID=133412 RepID=A0A1R1X2G2_9FUNG|nr:hypothetical protein AYI70_g11318 [Smittium culicis]
MSPILFAAIEVEEVCIDGIIKYVYKTPLKLHLFNFDRHNFFMTELTYELIVDFSNESDPVILQIGKDIFETFENTEFNSEQSTLTDSSSDPEIGYNGLKIAESKSGN